MLLESRRGRRNDAYRPVAVVAIVLTGLSACFKAQVTEVLSPVLQRDIEAYIHDTTPVRGAIEEEGQVCSTCHDGLKKNQGEEALKDAHSSISFDHGLNLLCTNCHNPLNSDTYVYHDGSEIPSNEPTRLCAKCHGPHYRDYILGIHGRTNGYWNPLMGEQQKLDCIQCHDPHHPKFAVIKPERPPVLTRFGLDSRGAHADDK